MLKTMDALKYVYRLCRLSKAYPRHPSSSKPAASNRRNNTGTNPDEKEKPSANWNWDTDPPNGRERTIDIRTVSGIIKSNAGSIFSLISLILISRLTKSFIRSGSLDVKIMTSEIRKGAISPGSINSIYIPL